MQIIPLYRDGSSYPSRLNTFLGFDAPPVFYTLGNLDILKNRTLGVFSSSKCPGKLILKTYDLAQSLRQQGITVISGFHSPMEKETLSILLRGKQPVVICPARNIGKKLAREYARYIEQDQLLILSPFDAEYSRITEESSEIRNRFVAAIADAIFIAHANLGGKLEALCGEGITWGKPVFTFDDAVNSQLIKVGVRTLTFNDKTRIFDLVFAK